MSFVNSPAYGVLSFLAKILSPVVGNTENTVKNSYHFAEFIRGKTLNADEVLVSFDVISLFTKIPVDLAIKVARKRLRQDVTLSQRTSMPIEDIIDLLSFCLNTTYFGICLFVSTPHGIYTISRFLEQRWVHRFRQ